MSRHNAVGQCWSRRTERATKIRTCETWRDLELSAADKAWPIPYTFGLYDEVHVPTQVKDAAPRCSAETPRSLGRQRFFLVLVTIRQGGQSLHAVDNTVQISSQIA